MGVVRPLEHVDVLVAELSYDADDTCTLHTDTSSDRVDSLIISLHCHLRTLARDTHNLLDGDETVIDFRNLLLEELLEELRACS